MARSPTSGIVAAQTAQGAYPGYLIQITVAAQTFRLCTLDTGFTYGGYSWVKTDIDLSGTRWDAGGVSPGVMKLSDPDLVWWAFTVNLALQDAPVSVWQVYASAPGEAEPLWSGRIGRITRDDFILSCQLATDIQRMNTPRRRVQHVVPAQYLLPAGKVLYIGTQQWVLERKDN